MSSRVRIVVSLVCGVLAIAIMAGYAASVRGQAAGQREEALERYGGEAASVCVAVRDIAQGEEFTERNVAVVEWLVDLLPEGALVDLHELDGKTAASAIAANTPISAVDVDARVEPLDVPAGTVAVSVPCTSESAVGTALVPYATVDVYTTGNGSAQLLSEGVKVLQTNASGTAASLSWAVLALDPSQVEAVIAASSAQRLYFALPSEEELERRAAAEDAVAEGEQGGDGQQEGVQQDGAGDPTRQAASGEGSQEPVGAGDVPPVEGEASQA